MIAIVLDVASWVLILIGSAFILIGGIGFVRMPDVYTRLHPASLIDTVGVGLIVCGCLLQTTSILVALKLLFLLVIFFFTGPVAAHAIAQAALAAGVRPQLHEDRTGRLDEPAPASPEPTPAGRG